MIKKKIEKDLNVTILNEKLSDTKMVREEKSSGRETKARAGDEAAIPIASGASMEEALNATKILAEDCRNQGTAFRLGVCLFSQTSV